MKTRKKIFLLSMLLIVVFSMSLFAQVQTVFTEDWETGTSDWTIVNGTSPNRWHRGTATATGAGTFSMYISADNGVSYGSSNSSVVVHFHREVTVPAGAENITLRFDHRSSNANAGFLKIYLFPTTLALPPSTPSYTFDGDQYPQYVIWQPNKVTENWETLSLPIPASLLAGQTKRLVFTYVQGGWASSPPPAALDNISLTYEMLGSPPPPPPAPPHHAFLERWEHGSSDWTIVNGTSLNRWYRGRATSTGVGSFSMYTSSDFGISYDAIVSSAVIHFYRDITLPSDASNITLSFQHRSSNAHSGFLKIYVLPTSFQPEASTDTYRFDQDPLQQFVIWQPTTATVNWFPMPTSFVIDSNLMAGLTTRLVFTYVQGAWASQPPPAAVDNIALTFNSQMVSDSDLIETPYLTTLLGNFPNPFNPNTTIRFSIQNEGQVNISIFNIRGQLVRELESGVFTAGEHNVIWDGRDSFGSEVAGGIYFYQMITEDHNSIRKMVMIK